MSTSQHIKTKDRARVHENKQCMLKGEEYLISQVVDLPQHTVSGCFNLLGKDKRIKDQSLPHALCVSVFNAACLQLRPYKIMPLRSERMCCETCFLF